MSQEANVEVTSFQKLAKQTMADQDFKPSRWKVLRALTTLLNTLELQRRNSAYLLQPTAYVPGWLTETEEDLLPFVQNPIGTALKGAIRRLGEIASRFMTIDEMDGLAEEAAGQCGDPGVRGCIVDRQ